MVRQLALDEKIAGSTPASPAISQSQFRDRRPPANGTPAHALTLSRHGAMMNPQAALAHQAGASPPAGEAGWAAASAAFLAWATFSASALARSCLTNSMNPE